MIQWPPNILFKQIDSSLNLAYYIVISKVFSTCDQLFLDGQLSCTFNMAAAANLENKQTSNNGYRKT